MNCVLVALNVTSSSSSIIIIYCILLFQGFSDVPRVDQQLLMAAEAYQPEMDESLNPHYYHVNALLFKMHQSRLTRNHWVSRPRGLG